MVMRDVVRVDPGGLGIAHSEHGSVRIHFGLDITDESLLLVIGVRKHLEPSLSIFRRFLRKSFGGNAKNNFLHKKRNSARFVFVCFRRSLEVLPRSPIDGAEKLTKLKTFVTDYVRIERKVNPSKSRGVGRPLQFGLTKNQR